MQVTFDSLDAADKEMEALLNGAYKQVRNMLSRNRAALDALIAALMQQVRSILLILSSLVKN